MVLLLLLPLLWEGSLQEQPGYELQVQESVTVQEGLCVYVPCSFSYPWSSWSSYPELYTYWYWSRDNMRSQEIVASNNPNKPAKRTQSRFFLANPWANNCSLSIRDARKSDTGTYFFRVERGYVQYTYRDKKLNLKVTALLEKPNIHILRPLKSGQLAQLTCSLPGSCKSGRPLNFSWEGAVLDSLKCQTLQPEVITFTPRPQDHGTNLTCQVKPQWLSMSTQITIRLNVSYAPQNLTIRMSYRNVTALQILRTITPLPILEGEALQLLCVADSNPPAQLSWFRGSPALNATPISSTAILELPRVGTAEEGEFTCQAQNLLGSQSVSLSLSVVYPPKLLGPSCSWDNKALHCNCSSRAQPAPSLRWWLRERLLEGNLSQASCTLTSHLAGPWANSSLSLSEELRAGLILSCEARNVHGAHRATLLWLSEKSVSQVKGVAAALGGAGVMALLSLCLCLIFFCIVKVRRKQAAKTPNVMTDEDLVMGTVTWGSQQNPGPYRPPEQGSLTRDSPPSEQQELHYANFSFHRMKPQEPHDLEASTHEYSEIKRSN